MQEFQFHIFIAKHWILVFTSCLLGKTGAGSFFTELDDNILFRINWPGELRDSKYSSGFEPTPKQPEQEQKKDGYNYDDISPYQLLKPLFNQVTCSYRLEQYWTYELCHGRFLRQYHEENALSKKHVQEYFLGKYDTKQFEKDEVRYKEMSQRWKRGEKKKITEIKHENLKLPFVEVNMTGGSICDLNGEHRMSRIRYVCNEDGKHEILSLKETSTCQYEVVVLSPNLCPHPDYRVKYTPETDILCHAFDGSPRKPRRLQALEHEARQYRLKPPEQPTWEGGTPDPSPPITKPGTTNIPPHDSKLIQDFLNGDYCLYGGSGWWKYEFCYGKKVEQYHEEKSGSRTTILLGQWNSKNHLAWIRANPQKRPKQGKVHRHVSQLYSGGAICEETGKPRQVEVKLKCKDIKGHPDSVSLYLLEPKTCEYILGVESPIICSLLQRTDENGLIHEYLS
ncbi:endoplasmic reticulum lectin 1-like isoform X2 [Limulus polyphemus]|uniref:Endoplasmic reticulum lectin 1 n=1 Tax=Limulus polyphemus TaxID=6850 RepID=A0ABM1T6Z5_LIMPO|nr:endoplasmic reticulum lectin 1-like isoform X2 [Limulus polyphemus]